jgi:threonine/homoserine/homoserine lactone efflux protein
MMINWVGFVPAALLVSLIPGASQLLGLSNAVRYGAAWALVGIAGRLAAFAVLIGLVVAGLGAILMTSETTLTVIKWVGTAYLAWIGVTSIQRARRTPLGGPAQTVVESTSIWRVVTNESFVAISNPKAMLLFAALLPQFTDGDPGTANVQIALLGAAYLGVELLVGLGYIGIGGRIGASGISARTRRRIDFGTGAGFLGMAGLLAADDLA